MMLFSNTYSEHETRFGNLSTPAPKAWQWSAGAAAALALHLGVAYPFLPKPQPVVIEELPEEGPEIGVNLAPPIQPPEVIPPEPVEPEPPEEIPVIQERANDSPPPAPPAEPREIPDLPDIRPQAVPELWTGRSGSGGPAMSLEDYLNLREWLAGARQAILERIRYPDRAARDQITGTARVLIVADNTGEIVEWRFISETGHQVLDSAISRTIRSVRRLPPFPENTRFPTLSYTVDIRFELVLPDGTILNEGPAEAPRATTAQQAQQQIDQTDLMPIGVMAQCAAMGPAVAQQREQILSRRSQLGEQLAEYERRAERYIRDRERLPRRVERLVEEYNAGVAELDGMITQFNIQAEQYSAQCGGAQVSYQNFAQVCGPYMQTGNAFCEAFGSFWTRLGGGE